MSDQSKIEWTDATWNPVRGCTKISPGCAHCYAETFAERFRGVPGHPYEQGFDLRLVPEKIAEPLAWKRPRKIFVNSMSDLFHKDVPDGFIANVFATMYDAQWHTFQVLTKRAERLASLLSDPGFPKVVAMFAWQALAKRQPEAAAIMTIQDVLRDVLADWPLPNVWIGVSVEDQKRADERIPHLVRTPAAVRFLSCEPLLSQLDLKPFLWERSIRTCRHELRELLGLVIIGGESGSGARPYNVEWPRSIIRQCRDAGVPAFHKQLGANVVASCEVDPLDQFPGTPKFDGIDRTTIRVHLRDKKGGDWNEWPADLRVREFPRASPAAAISSGG